MDELFTGQPFCGRPELSLWEQAQDFAKTAYRLGQGDSGHPMVFYEKLLGQPLAIKAQK